MLLLYLSPWETHLPRWPESPGTRSSWGFIPQRLGWLSEDSPWTIFISFLSFGVRRGEKLEGRVAPLGSPYAVALSTNTCNSTCLCILGQWPLASENPMKSGNHICAHLPHHAYCHGASRIPHILSRLSVQSWGAGMWTPTAHPAPPSEIGTEGDLPSQRVSLAMWLFHVEEPKEYLFSLAFFPSQHPRYPRNNLPFTEGGSRTRSQRVHMEKSEWESKINMSIPLFLH